MTAITIHLAIKNNQATLEKTLQSLLPLNGTLLVADLGSNDTSPKICSAYGGQVFKAALQKDYSKLRNNMLIRSKTEWNLFLNPWEVLLNGHDQIINSISQGPNAFRLQIIQGEIATKQTRLWNSRLNLQFINPVFETLPGPALDLPAYIYAANIDQNKESLEILNHWKQTNPLSLEPHYYESCILLSQRKWKEFLNAAEHYLFRAGPSMSRTMTQYYCSLVFCYVVKDYKAALQHLLECLAERPLMAEYWCLLGDIYYATKEYKRAKSFYENAMLLGSHRLNDEWPVEINKYKVYPETMLKSCDRIMQESKLYQNKTSSSLTTTVT